MKIVSLCLVLTLSGCASSQTGKALNVGMGISGVADLITTRQAIDQGRGHEANPLMGQALWRQAAVKTGGIGLVMAYAWFLERKDSTAWAHITRAALIVGQTYAAIHNHGVGR